MDFLKSSSFFSAGDLQRSQFADGAASQRVTGRRVDGEQQTGNRDTLHAFAGLSFESIDVSDQRGALADQAEALIMLRVWTGVSADNRNLTPSISAPSLERSLPLIEARNCLSNYVLSAFQ